MYTYILSNIMLSMILDSIYTYLEIIIILHVSNFVDGYLHYTMYMHRSCTHTTLVLCVCVCVCVHVAWCMCVWQSTGLAILWSRVRIPSEAAQCFFFFTVCLRTLLSLLHIHVRQSFKWHMGSHCTVVTSLMRWYCYISSCTKKTLLLHIIDIQMLNLYLSCS